MPGLTVTEILHALTGGDSQRMLIRFGNADRARLVDVALDAGGRRYLSKNPSEEIIGALHTKAAEAHMRHAGPPVRIYCAASWVTP